MECNQQITEIGFMRLRGFRILAVGLLCLMSGVASSETRDVNKFFFDQNLGDFKAELVNAKAAGKQGILLMFEQEDCPWCARMKATVLNQSEVQEYYKKHFAIFMVDMKGDTPLVDFQGVDTTEKKFSEKNRVRATPVFAFIDLDGNLAYRFTGPSKDVNEFLMVGRFVVEKAYKTQSFAAYKQTVK
jgi:thioredoxin-related protein